MNSLEELFSAAVWGKKIPPKKKWKKWIHRNLSPRHCAECLKLDGCWFLEGKAPKRPQHSFCHCIFEDIPYNEVWDNASSDSAYTKFDPYLFNRDGRYPHNKEKLFNSWGYTIDDSKWLQSEIKKQGLEKYIDGDYELGLLNCYGQRINIRVEIPRKNQSGTVNFITGWMVKPNGLIQLNTPFGEK